MGRSTSETAGSCTSSAGGKGLPTIILEGGHPGSGLDDYARYGAAFTSRLASERRVCAYDRAGYGRSDPAPDERPRQLEDVHADLQALLDAAEIEGPYVLVGSSFGGFIATTYASRFPEDVSGVVALDVPAPTATLTLTRFLNWRGTIRRTRSGLT